MTGSSLEPLFAPFRLKTITLRNRFVMPAMQRGFVDNCMPTGEMATYLRQRGEGGVGLIISESVAPDHPSAYWRSRFCQLKPRSLGRWRRVVEGVKGTGAHFLLQLWHPGSIREVEADSPYRDYPTLSPSGLIQKARINGRAISLQEIEDLTESYVRAAEYAKVIGADGIELHCCHGYFLDQFLWAETNQRDDGYGGPTLAERARFPAEILAAIRAAVGEDFVLSVRFSQFKEVDYGARIAETPEELAGFVRRLRAAGADCVNASSRRFYRPEWPDSPHPGRGIAGWAKAANGMPVISCGSVGLDKDMFEDLFDHQDPGRLQVERDLRNAAARLEAGEFDLLGVGRAHVANFDFVRKVQDGRFDEIELFNKAVHLSRHVTAPDDAGIVEKYRKVVDDI